MVWTAPTSARLPQAWQLGQRPAHFGTDAPHSVQWKAGLTALAVLVDERAAAEPDGPPAEPEPKEERCANEELPVMIRTLVQGTDSAGSDAPAVAGEDPRVSRRRRPTPTPGPTR